MNRRFWGLTLALLLLVPCAAGQGQGQRRTPEPTIRLPEDQALDQALSEMLAAWQVGDLEALHLFFADDVTVVSGAFEPPIVGWTNYAKAYQLQRQRIQQPRMERRNTLVHLRGNLAWASYQWEFAALVDGKPMVARGHTSLVLEKRRDRWVILHNHTSTVGEPQMTSPPAPQP